MARASRSTGCRAAARRHASGTTDLVEKRLIAETGTGAGTGAGAGAGAGAEAEAEAGAEAGARLGGVVVVVGASAGLNGKVKDPGACLKSRCKFVEHFHTEQV